MSPAMKKRSEEEPGDHLRRIGEAGEGPLDIAEAALMLSALDHSGRPLEPYRAHLADIAERAMDRPLLETLVWV